MTAKSSQFQVRESAASSSTDTEVTCLYGATRASPPVQVEKLKNVTDRINKSDQNYVQVFFKLTRLKNFSFSPFCKIMRSQRRNLSVRVAYMCLDVW